MTETMVERAARAMKAKLAQEEEVYFRDDGDTCMVDGHVDMQALARASIEEMRTLSPMMIALINKHFNQPPDSPAAEHSWSVFIDAALRE